MTREHCDNCDAVMPTEPPAGHTRCIALTDGTVVQVETIIYHPVTQRRVMLCLACRVSLIAASATV